MWFMILRLQSFVTFVIRFSQRNKLNFAREKLKIFENFFLFKFKEPATIQPQEHSYYS